MKLETIELLGAILGLAEELEVRVMDLSHYHLGDLSNRMHAVRLSAESFLQVFPEPDRACFDDDFDELFVILPSGVKAWAMAKRQAYPHLPRTVKGKE